MGETTVNQTLPRILAYNDAVVEFFNERKFPFAKTTDDSLTSTTAKTYTFPMSDLRTPGGIVGITLDGIAAAYTCTDTDFTFTGEITSGLPIVITYYALPSRQTTGGTFDLLPDRYRKVVAYLAASFILRSRHMNGEARDRLILYQQGVQNISLQQAETNNGLPKKFGYYKPFKRTYP